MAGFFPLDERWGLQAHTFSPGLRQQAVWLCTLLPYEQAAQVFTRLAGQSLPASTLWTQTQGVGQDWRDEANQQHVPVERTQWDSRCYAPHQRHSIGIDGGMVHVRGEGWKEFKVGVIGRLLPPPALREGENARSHSLHYTAVLGDVIAFSASLWRLAVAQGVLYSGHVAATADGAAWIWSLVVDLFPTATQIVDWYHACQHLAQAATTRFPDAPDEARTWLQRLKDHLWQGELHRIIDQLRHAGLSTQYFEQHQRRMDYPTFNALGYPIGSGTTESGVKQYKHRFCATGMRWSRPGLERLIILRSAVLDGSFDAHWDAA